MTKDRVTVKALRPTEELRAALRELARDRDIDFVAVETAAAGPQVVYVRTPCGKERLEGDVTRAQVEATIAKCDLVAKPAAQGEPAPEKSATPEPTPAEPAPAQRPEDDDAAAREEGDDAGEPAPDAAPEPKPDA